VTLAAQIMGNDVVLKERRSWIFW